MRKYGYFAFCLWFFEIDTVSFLVFFMVFFMRIWSLHPKYLDAKGLVALWREALLAQNVLLGKTRGYKNHPQLERFKLYDDSLLAMGFYLKVVYEEAKERGYNFDKHKKYHKKH